MQVSLTSTRTKSTGSSTTTGCGWSPATLAPSSKTSWDATSGPSTPTCSRRRTRTWWLNWTTKPARSKPSPSSFPASCRSACWCWSTPSFSSRGRGRPDTYCTANAPCRSGCESHGHKTRWRKHPKLADFGSRPASRSRRTARAFALIPPSRRRGAHFPPKLSSLVPLAPGAPAVGLAGGLRDCKDPMVHCAVQCHRSTWKSLIAIPLGFTSACWKHEKINENVAGVAFFFTFRIFAWLWSIYFQTEIFTIPFKAPQTK